MAGAPKTIGESRATGNSAATGIPVTTGHSGVTGDSGAPGDSGTPQTPRTDLSLPETSGPGLPLSQPPALPLPLWYTLPPGFRPVELSADPEVRLEAHYTALAELCPEATTGQLVASALGFEAALGRLVEDGLVHFSSYVLRTDDDLLLTGICQISVTDRPAGDPNLYPHSALRAHPDQPGTHKAVVPLPAGLAAVVVADQAVTVPGALFGVPGESTSAVRTATFQLAIPRIPQAVVVSLSTEVFEAEEEFLELATVMAAGVSFTAPASAREPATPVTAAGSPFG